jgi:hypothetical protein
VAIGPDAQLDECIVTDNVAVPPGAVYRQAILVRGEDGKLLASPLSLEP